MAASDDGQDYKWTECEHLLRALGNTLNGFTKQIVIHNLRYSAQHFTLLKNKITHLKKLESWLSYVLTFLHIVLLAAPCAIMAVIFVTCEDNESNLNGSNSDPCPHSNATMNQSQATTYHYAFVFVTIFVAASNAAILTWRSDIASDIQRLTKLQVVVSAARTEMSGICSTLRGATDDKATLLLQRFCRTAFPRTVAANISIMTLFDSKSRTTFFKGM